MAIPTLYTVLPDFTLPDRQGRPVSLWDYKHDRPVVLVVCAAPSEALLQEFARHYPAYRAEGAEVVAITAPEPAGEEWPFPVLIDAGQVLTRRVVERLPTVLVLDSYGELNARFEGPWEQGPNHALILAEIARVELRCPECGAPAWPR